MYLRTATTFIRRYGRWTFMIPRLLALFYLELYRHYDDPEFYGKSSDINGVFTHNTRVHDMLFVSISNFTSHKFANVVQSTGSKAQRQMWAFTESRRCGPCLVGDLNGANRLVVVYCKHFAIINSGISIALQSTRVHLKFHTERAFQSTNCICSKSI